MARQSQHQRLSIRLLGHFSKGCPLVMLEQATTTWRSMSAESRLAIARRKLGTVRGRLRMPHGSARRSSSGRTSRRACRLRWIRAQRKSRRGDLLFSSNPREASVNRCNSAPQHRPTPPVHVECRLQTTSSSLSTPVTQASQKRSTCTSKPSRRQNRTHKGSKDSTRRLKPQRHARDPSRRPNRRTK